MDVEGMKQKVALIGLSGSGKTTVAENLCLGSDKNAVDMDKAIDTSTEPHADKMLDWILESKENVLAVSVHVNPLREMANMKSNHNAKIKKIQFVYLHVTKNELYERLRKRRSEPQSILKDYDQNDRLFNDLKDETIKTTGLDKIRVAERVQEILNFL